MNHKHAATSGVRTYAAKKKAEHFVDGSLRRVKKAVVKGAKQTKRYVEKHVDSDALASNAKKSLDVVVVKTEEFAKAVSKATKPVIAQIVESQRGNVAKLKGDGKKMKASVEDALKVAAHKGQQVADAMADSWNKTMAALLAGHARDATGASAMKAPATAGHHKHKHFEDDDMLNALMQEFSMILIAMDTDEEVREAKPQLVVTSTSGHGDVHRMHIVPGRERGKLGMMTFNKDGNRTAPPRTIDMPHAEVARALAKGATSGAHSRIVLHAGGHTHFVHGQKDKK